MTALTAPRDYVQLGAEAAIMSISVPLLAGAKVYAGGVVSTTGGFGRAGRTSATDKVIGIARQTVDNTSGADGAVSVEVWRGTFLMANSTSGDLIAQADCFKACYLVDDATVAKTDNSAARGIAGQIIQMDPSGGVFVQLGLAVPA